MLDYRQLYDLYYPQQTRRRFILEEHSRRVAELARTINEAKQLGLDPSIVESAAMLHDIGIFLVYAPSIDCWGTQPYLRHGVLGADLLRYHHFDEEIARVAERHTGTGITAADVRAAGLPMDEPTRCMMPQSTLERLICYADKFFSKSANLDRKPLDRVVRSIARFGDASLQRFYDLHNEFNID